MPGSPDRLSEAVSRLTYILLNPAFNPKVAFLLYAWIAVFLLLILVVGIMFLMRPVAHYSAPHAERPARRDPRGRLRTLAIAAVVLLVAWGVAGYTTSNPTLCRNCHWPASQHARAAAGSDPHTKVTCTACHEAGGIVGRYLTGVPGRLLHFAGSQTSLPLEEGYGRVTVAACSDCHRAALLGVASGGARGLRMSHQEPMDASATCIDCHRLRAGVVATHNAGMTPCLRCHDAKQASAACETCHDEKAVSAARARSTSFAKAQIAEVTCGGCHDEKRECDGCHGTRMPHTAEFMAYAHARAATVDFWYGGGKACSRCHTATRRSCSRCHGSLLGNGHGKGSAWLAQGHKTATAQGCDTCHGRFAYTATRDFCADLCHTAAARAASPR